MPEDNWEYNLFPKIRESVEKYLLENNFKQHSGSHNLKSSFVACFNHLFFIRDDEAIVLAIAQKICAGVFEIDKVLKIPNDTKGTQGYISFEVTSENDLLKEGKPTRGINCTSVDALIFAETKDKKKVLIPIEWKYTEHYGNEDKSEDESDKKSAKYEARGKIRLNRYSDLIKQSDYLKLKLDNYQNSIYYLNLFINLCDKRFGLSK